jgi:circadian clock protein KaiB
MKPRARRLPGGRYRLRLIVTGTTIRSRHAIQNLRRACREYLTGNPDLEIIDIYQQPERAREYQVIVAPTLVRLLPLPVRRIVGDLSRKDRLMRLLDIKATRPAGGR